MRSAAVVIGVWIITGISPIPLSPNGSLPRRSAGREGGRLAPSGGSRTPAAAFRLKPEATPTADRRLPSQVETACSTVRLEEAGVFRYEPRTERLSVFVSYGFLTPLCF